MMPGSENVECKTKILDHRFPIFIDNQSRRKPSRDQRQRVSFPSHNLRGLLQDQQE
jgi:hypothetical protein